MRNQNRAYEEQSQQNRTNDASSTNYQGFLVRMWKDGADGLWRSSAQSVWTGEITRFANLTKLFSFLEAQTSSPLEDGPNVGWRSPRTRK